VAEQADPPLGLRQLDYAPPPPTRKARRSALIELAITLAVITAIAVLAPALVEALGRLR
jgi:hypothetical protein